MTKSTISNSMFFTIFVFCIIWGISGCEEEGPSPPPKIEIVGHDTTEWSGITVKYRYHSRNVSRNNGVGPAYVMLNTPEEVLQYKKQVEFLLKQLEEAERKMVIRSDQ